MSDATVFEFVFASRRDSKTGGRFLPRTGTFSERFHSKSRNVYFSALVTIVCFLSINTNIHTMVRLHCTRWRAWCGAIAGVAPDQLEGLMPEFIRDNAGKAFEFMVENVNKNRKEAGLCTVEEAFSGEGEKGICSKSVPGGRGKVATALE